MLQDKRLEKIKQFRLFVLKQIETLTIEQLNFIPEGYNNNIAWNLAHLLSTTQALCYKRSGLVPAIDEKYVTPFLPGTKPNSFISKEEIVHIKQLFLTTIDTLQTDIENNLFVNYTRSERIAEVYNMDILNINDAVEFLLYHEGYHTGYIMALKHLI